MASVANYVIHNKLDFSEKSVTIPNSLSYGQNMVFYEADTSCILRWRTKITMPSTTYTSNGGGSYSTYRGVVFKLNKTDVVNNTNKYADSSIVYLRRYQGSEGGGGNSSYTGTLQSTSNMPDIVGASASRVIKTYASNALYEFFLFLDEGDIIYAEKFKYDNGGKINDLSLGNIVIPFDIISIV